MTTLRTINQVIPAQASADGDGVRIQRVALFRVPLADPFLMLDELRSDDKSDFVGGFPSHPHRGMETLTIMRTGGLIHEDHLGHRGEITSGGAQWMSAGRGIMHSEMPTLDTHRLHGFQLWVNLAAAEKMQAPDYRDVTASEIPEYSNATAKARLIAGRWNIEGEQHEGALLKMSANAAIADVNLQPGSSLTLNVSRDETVVLYVYDGELAAPAKVKSQHFAILSEGDAITLRAGEKGLFALLLRGTPLKEPVAHYGPFVMNTPEQIEATLRQYRDGTFLPRSTCKAGPLLSARRGEIAGRELQSIKKEFLNF